MIKYRVNCNACAIIQEEKGAGDPKDSELYRLIERVHLNLDNLTTVQRQYEGRASYQTLWNHKQKHQHPSPQKLARSVKDEQLKKQKYRANEKLAIIAKKNVRAKDARQDIVDILASALEGIDVSQMSPAQILSLALKATKDTDDVEAKRKDQDLDILRIMSGARSGELPKSVTEELFDPWVIEGEVVPEVSGEPNAS